MNVLNSSPASPNASKAPSSEAEFIINYANKYEIGKFFSEVITPSVQKTAAPPTTKTKSFAISNKPKNQSLGHQ